MRRYEKYKSDILSGKVNHGKHIKMICANIENNLNDKSCPYYFDYAEADRYINFMQNLYFSEGKVAGTPVKLEDWQQFITANIFGWKIKESGLRRFTEATVHVPKKNGKSFLAAAWSVAVAKLDKDAAAQIYLVATSRDQASICFKAVKRTISATPFLKNYFRVMQYSVIYNKTDTTIKALSADAGPAEGLGSNLVIFDEYHLQKTDELKENLRSGQAGRTNPMFISISTAGTNRNLPYYKHIQKCKSILSGIVKNDWHFVAIYEADSGDWSKEKTWRQANPNYGVSVMPEFLKQECEEAKHSASKEPNFKTKHLNVWTDAHTTWISHDVWMKCAKPISMDEFKGSMCWMGLDLASSRDFTALSIIFQRDGKYYLFNKFWIPEDMANKRTEKDKIQFNEWARMGYITLTDGNVTDYDVVQAEIERISRDYLVQSCCYDPANASQLVNNLVDKSLPMVGYGQGIMNMSAPTKQMERFIYNGELIHEGNPVMAWMMGNVQIKRDTNDNMKIDKGKATDKVDGPVSCANAFGGIISNKTQYDTYYVA